MFIATLSMIILSVGGAWPMAMCLVIGLLCTASQMWVPADHGEACGAAPRPSHTLSVPASPLTRPLPSSSYIAATRDKSARPFDSNDIVNMAIPIAITAYTTYVTNVKTADCTLPWQ